MGLVVNMNAFQTVHCATAVILIISLLTEKCYSRNVEDNVQFVLSEQKNVKFVKKLRQPDLNVQVNNDNNLKLWYLDNPLDILEDKDGSTQQDSPSTKYLKNEGDNNSRKINKNRVLRQISNGYSPIYPSLPTFNPNAQNMYSTPYKNSGPQYNGYSLPSSNPYNPSNVNYFNNRFPQNSTFQPSVSPFNYSSRPSFYPHNQNSFPNNSTKPNYIQSNWHNQSNVQNLNHYNLNNNAYNYSKYSNTTNFNSGFRQPNYNQFNGSAGNTNNTNFYNAPKSYNFSNGTRNNPVYNTGQAINGSFNSQPFRYPNFSSHSYPTHNPNALNTNFRTNNSWASNYSQNTAFNPYYTPKTHTSNQTYPVNPTYVYNSSYSNYRNQQTNNQNHYNTNPQNNSYYNANKNQFNNSIGGTTFSRPNQNNFPYLNQSSYIPTTPISTPYFRPNTRSENNFGGPNQSYLTEPNHFFYTPGGNKINGSVNYNLPHKYNK